MRRVFLALFAALLFAAVGVARGADPALVLVTNAQSPIERLSSDEVRKLYLGVPLIVGTQRVRPLRNATNSTVREMFMQKVMFMSTPAYERQILSRVFRMGGARPAEFDEMRELLRALELDPGAVTYLPRSFAVTRPELKIIGEL